MKELVDSLPFWKRLVEKLMMKSMIGNYDLKEGYNIDAAKMIKPVFGEIPLLVVGGLRNVEHMKMTFTVLLFRVADIIKYPFSKFMM